MEQYPEEEYPEDETQQGEGTEYDLDAFSKIINELSPEDKVKLTKMINMDTNLRISTFEKNKQKIIDQAKLEGKREATQKITQKVREKEQIEAETEQKMKELFESKRAPQESIMSKQLDSQEISQINNKVDGLKNDLVDITRELREYVRNYTNSMNKEQGKILLNYVDGIQKSSDDIQELKRLQENEKENRLREIELAQQKPEPEPGLVGNLFGTVRDTFTGVTDLFNNTAGNLGNILGRTNLNINPENPEEEIDMNSINNDDIYLSEEDQEEVEGLENLEEEELLEAARPKAPRRSRKKKKSRSRTPQRGGGKKSKQIKKKKKKKEKK